jgi:hypothetical protein
MFLMATGFNASYVQRPTPVPGAPVSCRPFAHAQRFDDKTAEPRGNAVKLADRLGSSDYAHYSSVGSFCLQSSRPAVPAHGSIAMDAVAGSARRNQRRPCGVA